MATETFIPNAGPHKSSYRMLSSQALSPMSQSKNPFDMEPLSSNLPSGSERIERRPDSESVSAIMIRRLARHTTPEALRSMLLFAKDFVGADFVPTEYPEEQAYLTGIARFKNPVAAQEAQALLHGKQINANEPPILVEVLRLSPAAGARRTSDLAAKRANSSSSTVSSGRPSSRFNGTFQSLDRISPPNGAPGFANGGPMADGTEVVSSISNFFSPQSPLDSRPRASGKAVIGEDGVDDEPGELLKDPVAYAMSDMSSQLSRRSTMGTLPSSRFSGLSLSTGTATSPPMSGFASPRTSGPLQSPTSAMPPASLGANASFQMPSHHYQRHNFPPVNPADQNPPCNTLYVGNLPIDTSEDELKAMFSKQRGYKRLCFRTKQNGPMCFVEFEDVSFATKALNELYGHPLHNSVKGGIRLSFSKNPLGVRTGQPGGIGPASPMASAGPMLPSTGLGLQSFSTANGPPPGLAAPPGLSSTNGPSLNGVVHSASMGGFTVNDIGMAAAGLRNPQGAGMATAAWSHGGPYSDYMYGR